MRKKKKVAACIEEIAEMVVEKFTDKLGANKQAWKVQVSWFPAWPLGRLP